MFYNADSLSGGMQLRASRRLSRPDFVALAFNMEGGIIGTLKTRKGYTPLGSTLQSGKNITGLHSYAQLDGTVNLLATHNNSGDTATLLKRYASGSWNNITVPSFPENSEVQMFNFLNQAWIVGANSSDQYMVTGKLTNTTYSAENNFPRARYGFMFQNRIFLLDCEVSNVRYASRVYFSSIATADGNGDYTVNFNNVAEDWMDIRTNDGESLTGGIEAFNRALFFKPSSIHSWDGQSLQQLANVGAASNRSIVNLDNNVFFYHNSTSKKGIYMWNGAKPELISLAIKPFIDGIVKPKEVVGGVYDDRVFYYIGNVNLSQEDAEYYNIPQEYNNVVLEYNFEANQWFVHSLSAKVRVFAGHQGGIYFGDDEGNVYKFLSGTTDNGTAIPYSVVSNTIFGEDSRAETTLNHIMVNTFTNENATLRYSIDGKKYKKPEQGGEINDENTYFSVEKTGNRFQIKISGEAREGGLTLEGFSLKFTTGGRWNRRRLNG